MTEQPFGHVVRVGPGAALSSGRVPRSPVGVNSCRLGAGRRGQCDTLGLVSDIERIVVDTNVFVGACLGAGASTVLLAEADAQTRFRLRAQRGAGREARGLELLDQAAGRGAAC